MPASSTALGRYQISAAARPEQGPCDGSDPPTHSRPLLPVTRHTDTLGTALAGYPSLTKALSTASILLHSLHLPATPTHFPAPATPTHLYPGPRAPRGDLIVRRACLWSLLFYSIPLVALVFRGTNSALQSAYSNHSFIVLSPLQFFTMSFEDKKVSRVD